MGSQFHTANQGKRQKPPQPKAPQRPARHKKNNKYQPKGGPKESGRNHSLCGRRAEDEAAQYQSCAELTGLGEPRDQEESPPPEVLEVQGETALQPVFVFWKSKSALKRVAVRVAPQPFALVPGSAPALPPHSGFMQRR